MGSELRRLFPHGSRLPDEDGSETGALSPSWDDVPDLPVDVFAAAAHLLEASGAYQFIVAPFEGLGSSKEFQYLGSTCAARQVEIDRWTEIGRDWMSDPMVGPVSVGPYWHELWTSASERLVVTPEATAPGWWRVAHALLVIADEASRDLGYIDEAATREAGQWANNLAAIVLEESTERRIVPGDFSAEHLSRHVALDSLTEVAAREVVRVLPKGRTTELGCNMRTLSHNLTLLPPHGRANAYWHQSQLRNPKAQDDTLNLLLVPFPFVIPDGCFRGQKHDGANAGAPWGRFKVDQRWLTPHGTKVSTPASRHSFVTFVDALVKDANAGGATVNGIVLPEYALDWETYDALVHHALIWWPGIEFIVSGVSRDCNGRVGNWVTSTIILENQLTGIRHAQTHSRRKHHRWCLDAGQIRNYGLEADLDPAVLWWEHLEIEERVLHMDVFRSGSTMTAVVCEDLARVEPGLSLLRALGANLVFALLMDGPQIRTRWPNTYATGLADDPGSSVLTLSSVGLIARSNALRGRTGNFVALWKNRPRAGGPSAFDSTEIDVVDGQAILLELQSERAKETTLDGRLNNDTSAWYLKNRGSIAIKAADIERGGWQWIVGRHGV